MDSISFEFITSLTLESIRFFGTTLFEIIKYLSEYGKSISERVPTFNDSSLIGTCLNKDPFGICNKSEASIFLQFGFDKQIVPLCTPKSVKISN